MLLLLVIIILFPLSDQKILGREKRDQNSYGDENITEEETGIVGYEPQAEETAAPVENDYETDQPDVYSAGYRLKREGIENSYGNEAKTHKRGENGSRAASEEPL